MALSLALQVDSLTKSVAEFWKVPGVALASGMSGTLSTFLVVDYCTVGAAYQTWFIGDQRQQPSHHQYCSSDYGVLCARYLACAIVTAMAQKNWRRRDPKGRLLPRMKWTSYRKEADLHAKKMHGLLWTWRMWQPLRSQGTDFLYVIWRWKSFHCQPNGLNQILRGWKKSETIRTFQKTMNQKKNKQNGRRHGQVLRLVTPPWRIFFCTVSSHFLRSCKICINFCWLHQKRAFLPSPPFMPPLFGRDSVISDMKWWSWTSPSGTTGWHDTTSLEWG